MAISLKSTASSASDEISICTYGQSGAGKTSLIKSLPSPIVLSAEGGLLSLSDAEIPYIEIDRPETLREAYDWLIGSSEAAQFQSVALDSISEIGEVILSSEKAKTKDPRLAYGAMMDQVSSLIRLFRDLPGKHVYMSAKLEKMQDEMGKVLYSPSMPGAKTGQQLPYFFDEVLALRVEVDDEGKTHRALLCDTDGKWLAKDRSGKLDMWEPADLSHIINKVSK